MIFGFIFVHQSSHACQPPLGTKVEVIGHDPPEAPENRPSQKESSLM